MLSLSPLYLLPFILAHNSYLSSKFCDILIKSLLGSIRMYPPPMDGCQTNSLFASTSGRNFTSNRLTSSTKALILSMSFKVVKSRLANSACFSSISLQEPTRERPCRSRFLGIPNRVGSVTRLCRCVASTTSRTIQSFFNGLRRVPRPTLCENTTPLFVGAARITQEMVSRSNPSTSN